MDFGWPVKPHIGAGVGAGYLIDKASAPGLGQFLSSDAWEFGYQGIGGLRYDLTPNIAVDLDYRYFATTETVFLSTNVGGDRIHSDYGTHNVVVSLVYRFGP